MGNIFKIGLGVWDDIGVWLQLPFSSSFKTRSVCYSRVEVGHMFKQIFLNHMEFTDFFNMETPILLLIMYAV